MLVLVPAKFGSHPSRAYNEIQTKTLRLEDGGPKKLVLFYEIIGL